MSSESDALKLRFRDEYKLFDIRTVERNISRGLVNKADYQAWRDSLEDCSANMEPSRVTLTHTTGYRDGEGEARED
jgi:hypothetical protein